MGGGGSGSEAAGVTTARSRRARSPECSPPRTWESAGAETRRSGRSRGTAAGRAPDPARARDRRAPRRRAAPLRSAPGGRRSPDRRCRPAASRARCSSARRRGSVEHQEHLARLRHAPGGGRQVGDLGAVGRDAEPRPRVGTEAVGDPEREEDLAGWRAAEARQGRRRQRDREGERRVGDQRVVVEARRRQGEKEERSDAPPGAEEIRLVAPESRPHHDKRATRPEGEGEPALASPGRGGVKGRAGRLDRLAGPVEEVHAEVPGDERPPVGDQLIDVPGQDHQGPHGERDPDRPATAARWRAVLANQGFASEKARESFGERRGQGEEPDPLLGEQRRAAEAAVEGQPARTARRRRPRSDPRVRAPRHERREQHVRLDRPPVEDEQAESREEERRPQPHRAPTHPAPEEVDRGGGGAGRQDRWQPQGQGPLSEEALGEAEEPGVEQRPLEDELAVVAQVEPRGGAHLADELRVDGLVAVVEAAAPDPPREERGHGDEASGGEEEIGPRLPSGGGRDRPGRAIPRRARGGSALIRARDGLHGRAGRSPPGSRACSRRACGRPPG